MRRRERDEAGESQRNSERVRREIVHLEPLVYTVDEVAQILRVSRRHAYYAIGTGEIPSMKVGQRILVPRKALEQFIANGTRAVESDEPE